MYDIHTHLIPGVDDGPPTIEESLRMMKAAVEEGITHMVVTPHHHNGLWDNEKEEVIESVERLKEVVSRHNLPLTLRASQEIQITPAFLEEFRNNRYLSIDEHGKYYLVEFPWGDFPSYAEDYLKAIIQEGVTPIIAHPERQKALYGDLERLHRLVEMGCIIQVTNGSLIGKYGAKSKEQAFVLFEEDLVHVIASDTHHSIDRAHYLSQAIKVIKEQYGQERVERLLDNARKIYQSESI